MKKQISRIKLKDKEFIVDTKAIEDIGKKITRNSDAICILDYECFQDHGNKRFNLEGIWNIPFLFCASLVKCINNEFIEIDKTSFEFSKQNMNTDHLKKNLRLLFLKLYDFIKNNNVKLIVVMGGRTEKDFDSFCKKEFNITLDCDYFDLWDDFFLKRDIIQTMDLEKSNRIQSYLNLFSENILKETMPSKQIGKEATKFFTSFRKLKLNISDIRKHCFIDLDRGRLFLNMLNTIHKNSIDQSTKIIENDEYKNINIKLVDVDYDKKWTNQISSLEFNDQLIIFNRNEIDTFLYPLKRKEFHILQIREETIREKVVEINDKKISIPVKVISEIIFSKVKYIENEFMIIESDKFNTEIKNDMDESKHHQEVKKYFEQYCFNNDVNIIIHQIEKEIKRLVLKLKTKISEKYNYDITTKPLNNILNSLKETTIRFTSLNKVDDILNDIYKQTKNYDKKFSDYSIFILNFMNKLCFAIEQNNYDKN